MKFSNTVLLSLGLASAVSTVSAVDRTSPPFVPCYVLCPRVLPYVPVCGVDNVTYSECAAQKCYHVSIAYKGECSAESSQQQQKPSPLNAFSSMDECMCPDLFDPVCGADGKYYESACEAECAGTTVAKDLPDDGTASEEDCITPAPLSAMDDCMCPDLFDAVCGADGKYYESACEAECAGTTVVKDLPDDGTASEADCQLTAAPLPLDDDNCMCPDLFDAVCGADGKYYESACEAECAGTTVAKDLPDDGTASEADCLTPFFSMETMHDCLCAEIWAPVCGKDGEFYSNACKAKCAGTKVAKHLPETATSKDCN